ncbi:uncharacterized protein LOC144032968 isoform X2 [Festucalex cinctus]
MTLLMSNTHTRWSVGPRKACCWKCQFPRGSHPKGINKVKSNVGGTDSLKIEEMEKMLKEAQMEKARLIEFREQESFARHQLLEEERKRREEAEKRLQDETLHRQQLVEKEVKLRAKNFSQANPKDTEASQYNGAVPINCIFYSNYE